MEISGTQRSHAFFRHNQAYERYTNLSYETVYTLFSFINTTDLIFEETVIGCDQSQYITYAFNTCIKCKFDVKPSASLT